MDNTMVAVFDARLPHDVRSLLKNVLANLLKKISCHKTGTCTRCIGVCPDCEKVAKILPTLQRVRNDFIQDEEFCEELNLTPDEQSEESDHRRELERYEVANLLSNIAEHDERPEDDVDEEHVEAARRRYAKEPPVFYPSEMLSDGDVNTKYEFGRTALHNAVLAGNLFSIRILIQQGADPTVKDSSGNTPYMLAVLEDKKDVIAFFREQKIRA